jgi:hypothetical protein
MLKVISEFVRPIAGVTIVFIVGDHLVEILYPLLSEKEKIALLVASILFVLTSLIIVSD